MPNPEPLILQDNPMVDKWERVHYKGYRAVRGNDPAEVLPAQEHQQLHPTAQYVRLPQISEGAHQEYFQPSLLSKGQAVPFYLIQRPALRCEKEDQTLGKRDPKEIPRARPLTRENHNP